MKSITISIGSGKIRATFLTSIFSQAWGLMFQKPKPVLMDFSKERSSLGVHMFFCFWPLDIVFVSKSKEVVQVVKGIKPFHWMNATKPARYLVELPSGMASKHKIKVGTKLKFSTK